MKIVAEIAYVEELLGSLDPHDKLDEFERETLTERLEWLKAHAAVGVLSDAAVANEKPERQPRVVKLRSVVLTATLGTAAAAAALLLLLRPGEGGGREGVEWAPRLARTNSEPTIVHLDNAKIELGANTVATLREGGPERGVTMLRPHRAKFTVSEGPFTVQARGSEFPFEVRSITTTFQVAQREDGSASTMVRDGRVQVVEGGCEICVVSGGSLERQPGPAEGACGQWNFEQAFACLGRCGVCDLDDEGAGSLARDDFLVPELDPASRPEAFDEESRLLSPEAAGAFMSEADRLRELGHTSLAVEIYQTVAERGELSADVKRAYHWLRAMEGVSGPNYTEYTLKEQQVERLLQGR